jgi:hypothetical protein
MSNKQIALGAVAMALLLGGVYGIFLTVGSNLSASVAVENPPFVAGTETNATIEQLSAELDAVTKYEMQHGTTKTDERGNVVLTGKSKERVDALYKKWEDETLKLQVRTPAEVAKVKENIKAAAENPSLALEFKGKFNNVYTEKIQNKVETYVDGDGTIYTVNPKTNRVVEFTHNFVTDGNGALSKTALRARAEAYLAKNVPDFSDVKKTYMFEEGSKSGTMNVFRWNAPAKVGDEEMLPFVMVKLAPNGKLIGFSDTRSLYDAQ